MVRRCVLKGGMVPVIFDFKKSESRSYTEMVAGIAHLSRAAVVDISNPRSVPHELAHVVPQLPSVRFFPIIREGQEPYQLFRDLRAYTWVEEEQYYRDEDHLSEIIGGVIGSMAA